MAADFTPVCTTEMAAMAGYAKEFEKRGVKLLGISCDDVESHRQWTKDVEAYGGKQQQQQHTTTKVTFPILADPARDAIRQLNMVDPDEKDAAGRSMPSRALHVVGPDKAVKLSFLYPATTGRNMDEVLRAVEKGFPDVDIHVRGTAVTVSGQAPRVGDEDLGVGRV